MLRGIWCALAHRRSHWERIAGFFYVCDRCGREWRNMNGPLQHADPQAHAPALNPISSLSFATWRSGELSGLQTLKPAGDEHATSECPAE